MTEMRILLKPVSINGAFQGRRFKTDICNQFEEDFFKIAPKKEKILGIVEVEYKFHLRTHKRADYDNYIKVMQDLLVKCGYIEDDCKIYKATIEKIPSKVDFFEVKIKPYAPNTN